MTRRAVGLAVLGLLIVGAAVVANHRQNGREIRVGSLYSVEDENPFGGPSEFLVAKVLVIDDAVHVRVYKQRFRERPTRVDEGTLSVGSATDRDPGIGHMSLSRNAFDAWKPRFIQASAVRDEELDGYRDWQKFDRGVSQ